MNYRIGKRMLTWILAVWMVVTTSSPSVSSAKKTEKPDIWKIQYQNSAGELRTQLFDEKNSKREGQSWKMDLGEGILRNPVMYLQFRDKITLQDASLIRITGDGEIYNFKTSLSPQAVRVIDNHVLVLDFNHLYRYGEASQAGDVDRKFALRKDTAYQLSIPESTVSWKDSTKSPIQTHIFYFITRESEKSTLQPIWISSDQDLANGRTVRIQDVLQPDSLPDYPHHDYDTDYTAPKIIQGVVKGYESDNLTRFQLWRENAKGHFVEDKNRTGWKVKEKEQNRFFIHFNYNIDLNTTAVDSSGNPKYTAKDLTDAFELYETPYKYEVFGDDVYRHPPEDPAESPNIQKEKRSYRKWTGKEYRTTRIKDSYRTVWERNENNPLMLNPEQKVKIKHVEIVPGSNRLMIISDEPLLPHNRYILKIRKEKAGTGKPSSGLQYEPLHLSEEEYYRDILISTNRQTILPKGFRFEIWTKEADPNPIESKVKIDKKGYNAGTFIEAKESAKEIDQSEFIIHGAPRYDRETTPIVLRLDREVVLNPNSTHKFSGVRIIEGDHFNHFEQHEIPVHRIRIENELRDEKPFSTLKINPASTLKAGTPYTLLIDRDVFVSRAHEYIEYDWRGEKEGEPSKVISPKKKWRLNPPTPRYRTSSEPKEFTQGDNIRAFLDNSPLMFEFVIDGESAPEHGSVVTGVILHGVENLKADDAREKSLYSMKSLKAFKDRNRTHQVHDVDGGKEIYTEYLKFEIHGQNFNERIKDVVFTNRRTGHQIILKNEMLNVWDNGAKKKPSVEFQNVELLTGYLPESALAEMTIFPLEKTEPTLLDAMDPKSSQGVYDIAIHFESRTTNYSKDAPRLTLIDRPVVIGSNPAHGARYVDADKLIKTAYREQTDFLNLQEVKKGVSEADGLGLSSEWTAAMRYDVKHMLSSPDRARALNDAIEKQTLSYIQSYITENADLWKNFLRAAKYRTPEEEREERVNPTYLLKERVSNLLEPILRAYKGLYLNAKEEDKREVLESERSKGIDQSLKEYYVEVQIEDFAESFRLAEQAEKWIRISEKGKKDLLNDPKKPLILERHKDGEVKVVRIFIPLVKRLEEAKEYEWEIAPYKADSSQFGFYQLSPKNEPDFSNHGYKAHFSTNIVPMATRQYEGSVLEEYDPTYPVIIEGEKGFIAYNRLTRVYFVDGAGKRWEPDKIEISEENGIQRLTVYLPSRKKLPVGTYNILISNGGQYHQELSYAVFSVVPKTGEVPNEITKLKLVSKEVEVISERQRSKDHISIKNTSIVHEIDMDQLLGKMPRTVKVTVPVGAESPTLKLNSVYGKMVIEGIQPFFSTDKELTLQYGRPTAAEVSELRKELRGKGVCSDFVSLSDLNFTFRTGTLELKYTGLSTEKLTVMRYDRENFTFVPLFSQVDEANRTVSAVISEPGIYVAVRMK